MVSTSSVAALEKRVNASRLHGDLVALLGTAEAAAEEIERRVGAYQSDDARAELTAVKRFTFNAAADCWPGWSIPKARPNTQVLNRALEMARRSLGLVRKLGLGPIQEGTGIWLVGAFELALGRYLDAHSTFAIARTLYVEAPAPGLALLAEGYMAIACQLAGDQAPASADDLDGICAKILTGGFEEGADWVEQLHTARDSMHVIGGKLAQSDLNTA